MTVGRAWAVRNLGIDETVPIAAPPLTLAADHPELQRELIDFDSEGPEGAAFQGVVSTSTGLSRFVEIGWPKGLAPKSGSRPAGVSLPKCDVLIVTWTVEEGHALSRVLTPGVDSRNDWKAYKKNYAALSKEMVPMCPARQAGRLGTYWTCTIGKNRVTLFKSDSHMSQDGPLLPNAKVWRQIIEDSHPTWVITTGTGGGIGPQFVVGDVIVSRFARFDCKRAFKKLNRKSYQCRTEAPNQLFAKAKTLFKYNAQFLPPDNKRQPKIVRSASLPQGILTTDFFGFDNSANTYGLQGLGDLSEMGDAVLGLVCKEMGTKAPSYVVVRNVSDPQIDSTGLNMRQQAKMAADIYKTYGRWSSVCSAIVCWAITAEL